MRFLSRETVEDAWEAAGNLGVLSRDGAPARHLNRPGALLRVNEWTMSWKWSGWPGRVGENPSASLLGA